MQDPVMYDLNRYLAEESREQARAERLEEIAYSIRAEVEDALFLLSGKDCLPTEEAVKANARHEASALVRAGEIAGFLDEEAVKGAVLAAFRRTPEAHDLWKLTVDKAVDAYVSSCAEAELKRLEEVEAEDRALAGVC